MLIEPKQLIRLKYPNSNLALDPRVSAGSVAELASSIRHGPGGQIAPVSVVDMRDGTYGIISGHRRVQACENLNELVDIVVIGSIDDFDTTDLVTMMIEANIHEPVPPIILRNDQVVGGMCVGIETLAETLSYTEIADKLGISRDNVSSLHKLLTAHPKAQKAVASGIMGISAFARIKEFSPEEQEQIMNACGSYTLDTVKAAVKRYKDTPERPSREQPEQTVKPESAAVAEGDEYDITAETPSEKLREAHMLLQECRYAKFSQLEIARLHQLSTLVSQIIAGQGGK